MYRDGPNWFPAMRPGRSVGCIVMACDDRDEAQEIGREIVQVNSSCLRAYDGVLEFVEHPPREHVVAVILATRDDPETMGQTLQWTRHRWPRCPVTVVCDTGGEGHEMAARENGANFLPRPVAASQWRAVIRHAIGRERYLEGGSSPLRARATDAGPVERQARR
jgi:DNA-binding response OmpR family regulator